MPISKKSYHSFKTITTNTDHGNDSLPWAPPRLSPTLDFDFYDKLHFLFALLTRATTKTETNNSKEK